MKKYQLIILSLMVLAIVGAAIYFLSSSNYMKSFQWEGKAAYAISSKSTITTGGEKIEASISANGYFKTAPSGIDEQNPILYAILKNFKLQSSYGYERPKDVAAIESSLIMITFAKDGSIRDIALSPEISEETADAVRNIIYAAEIVLPTTDLSSWESLSTNGDEMSSISFSRDNDGIITKRRTSVDAPNVETEIISSQYTTEISRNFWIKSISGNEVLNISTPIGTVLNINTNTSYQPIPFDDSLLTALSNKKPAELKAEYAKLKGKVFDERRNNDISAKNVKAAQPLDKKEFSRIFAMLNDNSNDSYFGMVDFLVANPNYFDIVPDILLSMAKDNDNAARMLIGILEYIGTPVAQTALTTILADNKQSELSRVRAAVALNGVKEPTDAAIDAIKSQITIRGSAEDNMVSNTSYLTLGSAASRLMDGGSEKYEEIKTQILNDLHSSGDVPMNVVIQGAGNTADAGLYGNVAEYFTSPLPENRFAAVSAAGRLDSDRFSAEAGKFLENENDVTVRSGVYNSLSGSKNSTTVKLMTENVRKESGAARAPIMKYLTSNVNEPEVSKTLQELTASGELSPSERISVRKAFRQARGIKK